jgi:hypothetical protein
MENQYVVITKTCIGSLTIIVTNPSTGAIQRIVLRANEPKRMIPVATAALIYTDTYGGAYRMYKQGFFSFDDPQKVYDYAYNNGLIVGDPELIQQDSKPTLLDDIKKALIAGNRLEIDKFCAKEKGLEDVARVARSIVGELKQSTIKYVEEKIGVGLTVEGE